VLVDSHCHLDKLDYDKLHTGIDDVLNKAKERGVEYFLSVGVTLAAFPKMMEMIAPYDNVFASCGIHPLDVESGYDSEQFKAYARHEKVVAIGETGLDYHYQPETAELQQRLFREQARVVW
jgi:TatD DNase family protein